MNESPETTQFDVNLPKPRTHKVLIGVLVAVLVLGTIGVAAAAIANRAAQSQGEATATVMPPTTMMYFSLNTHADQLPNFNVIADAWKGSKEGKQVAAALELGFSQTGLNWADDVQPWLGERIALGVSDLGGMDTSSTSRFQYRAPAFVLAAQTKDHTKSDVVLANVFKQISKSSNGSIETETYRGIPITYVKSDNDFMPETGAYATVNDVVVLALGKDQLHTAINAALDGQSLATSVNYKTVMSALPGQTAGAMYMDFPSYMAQYFKMMTATTQNTEAIFDNIYTNVYSNTNATPDPAILKQMEDQKRQQAEARSQQEQHLQDLRGLMDVMGGVGMVMTYEPTGIRFDIAEQYDPTKMPEKWQKYATPTQTAASNRIFDALPNSAIVAMNASLKGSRLGLLFDPEYWAMSFSAMPGMTKDTLLAKFDEFQKATGVNLHTDILGQLNGDAAFGVLLRDQQKSDAMSFSTPVDIALLLDASDAGQLMGSFDKLVQGLGTLDQAGRVKVQNLSGLPYSAIMIDDKPLATYGVVDGRFVIGTDSNTLVSVDNADQASLSSDATFKQATGLLPGDRLNTAYVNFQPVWNLISTQAKGTSAASIAAVLNYFSHFKWVSVGDAAPANGLVQSSVHIGVGQ
jgi:hypothetical protein